MGLFDSFRRKNAPGTPTPAESERKLENPPTKGLGTTRIEREHFLLHAPFEWKAIQSENPLEFEFRNQTLPEQLLVTVLLAASPFGDSKRAEVVEMLYSRRREVILQMSDGRAVISPKALQTGSGQAEMRAVAIDQAKNLQHAFVIRVAAEKVVTAALTRYTCAELGTPFEAYAGVIFDFLQVKNPGAEPTS